jgi:hypothetical protein
LTNNQFAVFKQTLNRLKLQFLSPLKLVFASIGQSFEDEEQNCARIKQSFEE